MKKPFVMMLVAAWGGTLALTACGGAPPGETVGASHDPIHVTQWASIGDGDLHLVLGAIDAGNCTLTVSNGTGTFTPSASLAKIAYPADTNPQDHTMTFSIPSFMVSTPNGIPTAWATFTSLTVDATTLAVAFEPTTLDATITASGTVHLQMPFPWPNPDLHFEPFGLTIKLGIDAWGHIVATVVPPAIGHNVTGCGALGWCDGIVNSAVPDNLGALLASKLQDALNATLSEPSSKTGLTSVLAQVYNGIHNIGHLQQDWTVDPQTINIANSQFNFVVSHDVIPAAPTGCHGEQLCTGAVDVRCDMIPEVLVLERLSLLSFWYTVGTGDNDPNRPILPDLTDPTVPATPPSWMPVAYYHVCATNTAGKTCGANFGVPLSVQSCGGGGGGGGGGTPHGRPGGGGYGIPTY